MCKTFQTPQVQTFYINLFVYFNLPIEFSGRPAGPMIVLNMEYGKNFSGAG